MHNLQGRYVVGGWDQILLKVEAHTSWCGVSMMKRQEAVPLFVCNK